MDATDVGLLARTRRRHVTADMSNNLLVRMETLIGNQ